MNKPFPFRWICADNTYIGNTIKEYILESVEQSRSFSRSQYAHYRKIYFIYNQRSPQIPISLLHDQVADLTLFSGIEINCLARKANLVKTLLKAYSPEECWEIVPETFVFKYNKKTNKFLFPKRFREEFETSEKHWIIKNTYGTRAEGIILVRNYTEWNDFVKLLQEFYQKKYHGIPKKIHFLVAQRYIMNPLLLDGRKFDLRVFALIACTNPVVAFYHYGGARVCGEKYSNDIESPRAHLSNQSFQKDGDLLLSWPEFLKELEKTNVYENAEEELTNGMVELLGKVVSAASKDFDKMGSKYPKLSLYQFVGMDVMIQADGSLKFIEANKNPGHLTIVKTPGMLQEMADILMEIRHLKLSKYPVTQETSFISQRSWVKLKMNYCQYEGHKEKRFQKRPSAS